MVLASLASAPAATQTLEAELLSLIDTHPQIRAEQDNVAAAREGIGVASASYLPRVSLSGQNGFEEIDSKQRRDDFNESFARSQERLTVTVTQNLFDGSRKRFEKESAQITEHLATDVLESTRQNTLFEGVTAYIDVLRQTLLVDISRTNEEVIRIQLNLEDERVRRGSGIAVDALLAKSRLQLAREQRVVFEGASREAADRYLQVFNHWPDAAGMSDPLPPYHLLPASLDESVQAALSYNPLIANSSRQIDLARSNQRVASSAYYPRIDLVGTANWEDDINAVPGLRRDWSVVVRSTWDLFSGFATRSSAAQVAFEHAASLNNHVFVNRKIEEEVRLAWQGVRTSCHRRVLLRNAVNIAAEVWEARKLLREAGRETVINVLDAATEVFNAQINLAGATFDEVETVYRMLSALGWLTTDNLAYAATIDVADFREVETQAFCEAAREIGYLRPSEDPSLQEIVTPEEGMSEEISPFEIEEDGPSEDFDFDFDFDSEARADPETEAGQAAAVAAQTIQVDPIQVDPIQADPLQADPLQADPLQAEVGPELGEFEFDDGILADAGPSN